MENKTIANFVEFGPEDISVKKCDNLYSNVFYLNYYCSVALSRKKAALLNFLQRPQYPVRDETFRTIISYSFIFAFYPGIDFRENDSPSPRLPGTIFFFLAWVLRLLLINCISHLELNK